MKREEKNALSRKRILDAAIKEFSEKGYAGASLNTVCAEKGISKGIIYHYYKDKDELYLACVTHCFEELTAYMKNSRDNFSGTQEEKLQSYFEARMRFFTENPMLLGIYTDVAFNPPASVRTEIAACRREFDEFCICTLTGFLSSENIREGLSVSAIVEDFRCYIDYFNMRFAASLEGTIPSEEAIRAHKEKCRRQLSMLLYGVLRDSGG